MSDTIYLVIGGAYSDWWIDSYFIDEEKAEKYCLVKNKGKDEYDSLYVSPVTLNSSIIDYDNIDMNTQYHVSLISDHKQPFKLRLIDKECYLGKRRPTRSELSDNGRWREFFTAYVTADSEEKAKKIAFDLLASEREQESYI